MFIKKRDWFKKSISQGISRAIMPVQLNFLEPLALEIFELKGLQESDTRIQMQTKKKFLS